MNDKNDVSEASTNSRFKEGYLIMSEVGTYTFDIENPYSVPMTISFRVYMSDHVTINLDQNSQHTSVLRESKSEDLEVNIAGEGLWQMWFYACTGHLEIMIKDDPNIPTTQRVKLSQGQDYMYASSNREATKKHLKMLKDLGGGNTSQYFVSSSHFSDSSPLFFDYRAQDFSLNHEIKYDGLNSKLNVKLRSISFWKLNPEASVVYHIRACPFNPENPDAKNNLCDLERDCKMVNQRVDVNGGDNLEASFTRLSPGKYYIAATATVEYMKKVVKFFPFHSKDVEISAPLVTVKSVLWTILIVMVVLLVGGIVCTRLYKTLKTFGEERGYELKVFGKKRGYDFLGDEQ